MSAALRGDGNIEQGMSNCEGWRYYGRLLNGGFDIWRVCG